jgi:hypothetical protein
MTELLLDSLRRRMAAMHSLWRDAVDTMDADQVNHVERGGVLPIAFSLFHMAQLEDGSAALLGAGPVIYDDALGDRMGLAIKDHGKARTVDEMQHQRIGDYEAFKAYQRAVFERTEAWLATVAPEDLDRVVVGRPFPPEIVHTYSARVAGDGGVTLLDAVECWIYQHGLRHMGEIEHARALVGLGGMTS